MGAIQLKTAVPGPKSAQFLERRKKVVAGGVATGRIAICADYAEGATLVDIDGNRFIDFTGGIGCLNAGHSAPRVIEAVQEQAGKLQHTCFQVTMYEPYVALAEKLVAITPGDQPKKACLFNSGAEAVENAIKIARRFTGRQAVVCFEHAFHGRTLLTMSLTSKVKPYKDGFGPFAPEIYQAPLPYSFLKPKGLSEEHYTDDVIARLHRFLKATVVPERIAAFIIEPVLGEGGFIVPPARFLLELQKIARDNGIVLIADEIQSGFGRTGKMFACEHSGLKPDLVTLAKSMSNGFPVSAVVGRADILDSVPAGGLGGTFGGNPVCCVAALAAIETIEREGLCERSNHVGLAAKEKLSALAKEVKCIGEVRGLGSMIGIELVPHGGKSGKELADAIVGGCGQKGLLILSAGVEGNIIRLLMPLCIKDAELNEAMGILAGEIKAL